MKHYFFYFVAVLIFTFFIHITYIPNGFTWLDHRDIELNRAIIPLSQIHKVFTNRFADTGFYRPMVTIIHSLDNALYKNWAPGFHLTNVLLHTATTAVLPGFLAAFFILKPWPILLATLIFGIHPFSILPVGAISYRPELLLALFIFLTISFYAKVRQSPNLKNLSFFLICLFLALISKETAIVIIPPLFLLWEFLNIKKLKFPPVSLLLGIITIFITYILLRIKAVPETWRTPPTPLPLSEALGTRLSTLGKLLIQMVIPFKPNFSDTATIINLTNPFSLLILILLIGIFLILVFRRFSTHISTTILLLIIFLAPSLHIIPLPRFSSPHYGYLAIGVFAMLIVLLISKTQRLGKTFFGVAVGIWLLISSLSTFRSGYQFKNDLTLFLPEVKKDPNFLEGHYYLGNHYLSKGDLNVAQKHYRSLFSLPKNVIAFGDRFSFYLNLGNISMLQGQTIEAEKFFDKASSYANLTSQRMVLDYNRAILAQRQGDHQKVIQRLTPYINQWNQPEPLVLLARSLAAVGREKESKQIIQDILPLLPPDQREKIKKILDTRY